MPLENNARRCKPCQEGAIVSAPGGGLRRVIRRCWVYGAKRPGIFLRRLSDKERKDWASETYLLPDPGR